MRRIYLTVTMLALAACTSTEPVKFLYKPGATEAGKQAAIDQCRIASFREIPQAMVSETSGGYYNPGNLQCSSVGGMTNCYRVGAVDIPPTTTTYDVNGELRGRYIDQCLQANGFSITVIPQCKTEADRKTAADAVARGGIPQCATHVLR